MARNRSGQDYLTQMQSQLFGLAVQLQNAQTNLSQTQYDFSPENKYVINSQNITLLYNVHPAVGNTQTVNAWAASIQLAVAAFKARNQVTYSSQDTPVWFILTNAMNNILVSMSQATQGILNDTSVLSTNNKQVLLILLLVASGCLLISLLVIMPVVTKVHQDKDKLLSLFLKID